MTTTTTDLLTAALGYADRGWPVFPLQKAEKLPIFAGGFKIATTDPDKIRKWWTFLDEPNIGIATGHAFDVIDMDGPVGRESFARALGEKYDREGVPEADRLPYTHPGPVSLTPRPGIHLLVQPIAGLTIGADPELKIDYRGLGGYICAAPSIHPNGGMYTWGKNGPDTPIPVAEDWIVELLRRPQPAMPEPRRGNAQPAGPRNAQNRPDIIAVASALNLQPQPSSGGRWKAVCPFHEDHSPSLVLYPDSTFACFVCCIVGDSHQLAAGTFYKRF